MSVSCLLKEEKFHHPVTLSETEGKLLYKILLYSIVELAINHNIFWTHNLCYIVVF
jgi:hypothetical protein